MTFTDLFEKKNIKFFYKPVKSMKSFKVFYRFEILEHDIQMHFISDSIYYKTKFKRLL